MTPRTRGMDRLSAIYNNAYYRTANAGLGTVSSHNAGLCNVVAEATAYMATATILRNGRRILAACAVLQAQIEGW